MDYSLLQPLLGFAALLLWIFIDIRSFAKLTPEQQQDVKAAQSVRVLLVVPLLLGFRQTIKSMGKLESVGWTYLLVWAVPVVIILAWEHRRLRATDLPSGFLKNQLISGALWVGGSTLLLLWL
jgi:hypothetical protein